MKTILAVLILATSAIAAPPGVFTLSGKVASNEKGTLIAEGKRIPLSEPPTVQGTVVVKRHPLATTLKAGADIKCVVKAMPDGTYLFLR